MKVSEFLTAFDSWGNVSLRIPLIHTDILLAKNQYHPVFPFSVSFDGNEAQGKSKRDAWQTFVEYCLTDR